MAYDVTVPVDNARGYGTFNYQDGVFVLSNSYAMVAVYDDEGWDLSLAPDYGDPVYAETSFYQVQLTVPEDMVLVTSGSTLGRVDNFGGTSTWSCLSGPMRDFMVVASNRFVSSSLPVGSVRLNSYYLPEHQQGGEAVLNYARDCLRAYQQSFGPYPFAEFDVVEAPIAAGGMEFPGLVIIDDDQYASAGAFTEFLVAHEVAHQWWYSLVGNDQVNVPWLDESLTNFSVVYYYENTYGGSQADLAFETYVASRYDQAKSSGRDGVVFQAVAEFEPQDYGPIVYGKGAVFFYELREQLGDELFLDVLRAYLEDRKYKLATPDDLMRIAEQVSGQELDPLYELWILSAE
jgi:aminopeptidase N